MKNIPRHALSFMSASIKLASKHGLKRGIAKAAADVNPALLVIECAYSVGEAVYSYFELRKARAHRDGLRELIPLEEQRLLVERKQLQEQITLAKSEISQNMEIQKRLGELAMLCGQYYKEAWNDLHAIRSSDIPDIEEFDRQLEVLESAWSKMRQALELYNQNSK